LGECGGIAVIFEDSMMFFVLFLRNFYLSDLHNNNSAQQCAAFIYNV